MGTVLTRVICRSFCAASLISYMLSDMVWGDNAVG
jgi:hypothetical protein